MSKMLFFPQSVPDFHVALSLSLVIFGFDGVNLDVLLAKSKNPLHEGKLFLPSRNLAAEDDLFETALEMFQNLFGHKTPNLIEQLKAFGAVKRSSEGRVVNIAHNALVKSSDFKAEKWEQHGMHWCPVEKIPELNFDHNEIVQFARDRLSRRVRRRPLGFYMLPNEFTLGQLKRLYEKALSIQIDKRNFRKKLFKTNLLEDLGKKADGRGYGQHKGSLLYKFNMKAYKDLDLKGYHFQF